MGEYLDEDKVFFKLSDGKEYCNKERALGFLLLDDVLFSNEREVMWEGKKDEEGPTTVLYVVCNDLFGWACADAERLPEEEIGNLFKMWKADKKWGPSIWCMKRRNAKPQKPVEDLMKQEGVWTSDLDNLGAVK